MLCILFLYGPVLLLLHLFSLSVCQMLKYFAAFEVFFEENLPRLFSHFQTNNLTPDLYLIDWWVIKYYICRSNILYSDVLIKKKYVFSFTQSYRLKTNITCRRIQYFSFLSCSNIRLNLIYDAILLSLFSYNVAWIYCSSATSCMIT